MNDSAVLKRRAAFASDLDIERQDHGQIAFGYRHDAALRAMNHRNGRAPITLARDAPIFDAKRIALRRNHFVWLVQTSSCELQRW